MEMSTSHQNTTKKKRIQVDLAFVRSLLTEHLVGQALSPEHRLLLCQCEETKIKEKHTLKTNTEYAIDRDYP